MWFTTTTTTSTNSNTNKMDFRIIQATIVFAIFSSLFLFFLSINYYWSYELYYNYYYKIN